MVRKYRKLHAVKRCLAVIGVWVVMIACSLPVLAMGFDAETVYHSVVIVASAYPNGQDASFGSGFAIGKDIIITNAHVIASKDNTEIGTYGQEMSDVDVIAMDTELDIAVLQVSGMQFTPLKMADLSSLRIGEDVYAIGAPKGLDYTLTKGVISAKQRVIAGQTYIQTDVAINPGNSGGPLLNDAGEVVGVNALKVSDAEGLCLAIPINVVQQYLSAQHILWDEDGAAPRATSPEQTVTSSTEGEPTRRTNPTPRTIPPVENAPPSSSGDSDNLVVILTGCLVAVCDIVGLIVYLVVRSNKRKPEDTLDIPVAPAKEPEPDSAIPVREEVTTPIESEGVSVLTGSLAGLTVGIANGQTLNVGKDPQFAHLVFDSSYPMVSRMHCTITYSAPFDKYFVTDCSSNGTYFADGQRLIKGSRTPVVRGAILKLADDHCTIQLL